MRLDIFLNKCCIVKHRTEAKRACDNGIVTLDGHPAKASRDVAVGQKIFIGFTDRHIEIEVLNIPQGNVSRKEASMYYTVLRDEVQESEFI